MDFSLFDEASRDYDREALERRTALVRTAVTQDVMPFLAMAATTEEYMHRRALAAESLQHIAAQHGASVSEVEVIADRMYGMVHAARRAKDDGLVYTATAQKCGNCKHQSTDHTEGLRCSCGCADFVAAGDVQTTGMRREAGEGSGPFS
jgi:hypothetical protein